jgi:hypothetical protein
MNSLATAHKYTNTHIHTYIHTLYKTTIADQFTIQFNRPVAALEGRVELNRSPPNGCFSALEQL